MEHGLILSQQQAVSASKGELAEVRVKCKDQTAKSYQFCQDRVVFPISQKSYTGWAKDCGCVFLLPTKPPWQVGDMVYGREAHITGWPLNDDGQIEQFDEDGNELSRKVWYRADNEKFVWADEDGFMLDNIPWRSSTQMPKWAARFWWEIIAVSVKLIDGKWHWVYKLKGVE